MASLHYGGVASGAGGGAPTGMHYYPTAAPKASWPAPRFAPEGPRHCSFLCVVALILLWFRGQAACACWLDQPRPGIGEPSGPSLETRVTRAGSSLETRPRLGYATRAAVGSETRRTGNSLREIVVCCPRLRVGLVGVVFATCIKAACAANPTGGRVGDPTYGQLVPRNCGLLPSLARRVGVARRVVFATRINARFPGPRALVRYTLWSDSAGGK
jgi:hypothetical protein